MGFLGSGLGLQSPDEYTNSVGAHVRLREMQRGNQTRINQLGVASKQQQAPGLKPITAPTPTPFVGNPQPALQPATQRQAAPPAIPPTTPPAPGPGAPGPGPGAPGAAPGAPAPGPGDIPGTPAPGLNAVRPAPNIGSGLPAAPVTYLDTSDISEDAITEGIDAIVWISDPQQAGLVKEIRDLSYMFDVDPSAALALRAIENRIQPLGGPIRAQRRRRHAALRKWFSDPANIEAVRTAFNTTEGFVNPHLQDNSDTGSIFDKFSDGEYPVLAYLMYSKTNNVPVDQLGKEYIGPLPFGGNKGNILDGAFKEIYNYAQDGQDGQAVPPIGLGGGYEGASTEREDALNESYRGPPAFDAGFAGAEDITPYHRSPETPAAGVAPAAPAPRPNIPAAPTAPAGVAPPAAPAAPAEAAPEAQPTVSLDGAEEPSAANLGVEPQPPARFLANPPAAGQEIKSIRNARDLHQAQVENQLSIYEERLANNNQALEQYNTQILDLERRAQVSRISGDLTGHDNYKSQANELRQAGTELNRTSLDIKQESLTLGQAGQAAMLEYDNKLLYTNGMQALQDLTYGSPSRASAVASAYAGVDVKVVALSNGEFDFEVEGELQATYSLDEISDKLRSAFDAAYRGAKAESEGERNTFMFKEGVKADIETAKQIILATKEINIANINAIASINVAGLGAVSREKVAEISERAGLKLEELKQAGASVRALGDGSGKAVIKRNGLFYMFDPLHVTTDINGDTNIGIKITDIPLGEAEDIFAELNK